LQTSAIDFATMQRLRRFSRAWDLIANSGNFVQTTPRLWTDNSAFDAVLRFSDWLFEQTGKSHGIALQSLAELLFKFLTIQMNGDETEVAKSVWRDYQRAGRSDRPRFLLRHLPADQMKIDRGPITGKTAKRQMRHLG
jgi:hypothetical protein